MIRNFSPFAGIATLLVGFSLCPPSIAQAPAICSGGCVTTYGYDNSRDNINNNETVLKASNLTLTNITTSPDLFGAIYAQPLYLSGVTISGKTGAQNVLYVATEENQVYALDGATLTADWTANLNKTGETPVPDTALPGGCTNIPPEVGITGTPVIDTRPTTPILYVVSRHQTKSIPPTYLQRLNAINVTNGSVLSTLDLTSSNISALSVLGNNQRAGLALTDTAGTPYIVVAWGSHCDSGSYTGVVGLFKYSSGSLSLLTSFDDEGSGAAPGPNGGIWMSGAAPAIDDSGETSPSNDAFLAVGNGSFNGSTQFGESVLALHYPAGGLLNVVGSYTPNAWKTLNQGTSGTGGTGVNLNLPLPYAAGTSTAGPQDFDLGSGGVTLARPKGFTLSDNFVVLAGGKEGVFYVNSPTTMIANITSNHGAADSADPCSSSGTYSPVQCFSAMRPPLPYGATDYGNRGSAGFWGGNSTDPLNVLYVAGAQDLKIRSWQMDPSAGTGKNGSFLVNSNSALNYGMYGYANSPIGSKIGYPSISPVVTWDTGSSTTTDAILWILDTSRSQNGTTAPMAARLYAYHAVPTSPGGLFATANGFSDASNGPGATKFMVPTVINGYVYVAGQKSGTTCTTTGTLGACVGKVVSWH